MGSVWVSMSTYTCHFLTLSALDVAVNFFRFLNFTFFFVHTGLARWGLGCSVELVAIFVAV